MMTDSTARFADTTICSLTASLAVEKLLGDLDDLDEAWLAYVRQTAGV